jgi:hypothetical protein
MSEECCVDDVMVVAGAVPGHQSLNEQVLVVRKVAEVVASQKDQAIGERTGPVLGERLVGRRSSLENEARIRTIRGTEGRMTGPCEGIGVEELGRQAAAQRCYGALATRAHESDSNWLIANKEVTTRNLFTAPNALFA